MPASYVIDASNNLVLTTLEGRITTEDLLGHVGSLEKDPAFSQGMNQIVDGRRVTEVAVSAEALRTHGSRNAYGAGVMRVMILPRPALYGLGRLYAAHREELDERVVVVHEVGEALAALGLQGRSITGLSA